MSGYSPTSIPSTTTSSQPNNKRPPRVMRTKEQWRALVSEFESSDLTQAEFCRQKKISSSGLHKWRKHYAENITSSDFIDISQPLSLQSHPEISQDDNTSWQVELELGKGIILRMRTA